MTSVFRSIGWIFFIWIAVNLIGYSECIGKYTAKGSNLCTKIDRYQKNITVPRTENVKVSKTRFCARPPFICTYEEWEPKIVEEVVTVNHTRTISECCKGYDNIQGSCVPTCQPLCGHGECITPNLCFCDEGWKPPLCLQECDSNQYGSNCMFKCSCENGGTCDKKHGLCDCAPGYTGDYCQDTCQANVYGENCSQECKCQNDAVCNSIDGSCECEPGYTGQNCEERCEEGSHGKNCEEECVCLKETTEKCHHATGECICKIGNTGVNCEHTCEEFTYGRNCSKKCSCDTLRTSLCDPYDGFCTCEPGWTGDNCSEPCPVGKFGEFCVLDCAPCPTPSHTCNSETGFCDCPPGSFGDMCHKSCPDGWWGTNCNKQCSCTDNEVCNLITGKCLSEVPSENSFTVHDTGCPNGFWGTNCSTKCNCRDNELCLSSTGKCYLPATLPSSDINLTEYPSVCPDGWWGSNCSEECRCGDSQNANMRIMCDRSTGYDCVMERTPKKQQNKTEVADCGPHYYGPDCKLLCSCSEEEICDRHTGACSMKPHTDISLDVADCDPHYFGPGCKFLCNCSEEEICNRDTGACSLQSHNNDSFEVADCGPQYYGPGCKSLCSCSKEEICDRHTGACVLQLHKSASLDDLPRGDIIAICLLIPILCLALLAMILLILHHKGYISLQNLFGRRISNRNTGTPSCAASTDFIVGESMNNPMYGCHDSTIIPLEGPQFEHFPSVRYSKNSNSQDAFPKEHGDEQSKSSVPIYDTLRTSAMINLESMWPTANSEQETKGTALETSTQSKEDTQRLSSVLNNLKVKCLKENGKLVTHNKKEVASDSTSFQFENDFIATALGNIDGENQYENLPSAKENTGATDTVKKAN